MNFERLRSVEHVCSLTKGMDGRPAIAKTTLYEWIARADETGIGPAVVRVGRKVLIDVDEFNLWLDRRRVARASGPTSSRPAPARGPARNARTA